jgi:hypothetical protein
MLCGAIVLATASLSVNSQSDVVTGGERHMSALRLAIVKSGDQSPHSKFHRLP